MSNRCGREGNLVQRLPLFSSSTATSVRWKAFFCTLKVVKLYVWILYDGSVHFQSLPVRYLTMTHQEHSGISNPAIFQAVPRQSRFLKSMVQSRYKSLCFLEFNFHGNHWDWKIGGIRLFHRISHAPWFLSTLHCHGSNLPSGMPLSVSGWHQEVLRHV